VCSHSGCKNDLLNAVRLDTPVDALAAEGTAFKVYGGAQMETADNAVAGKVNFFDEPTFVGRQNIDWSGQHHHNQEWQAQLNRFLHLNHLSHAYLKTGKKEYAQAARDYIADWLRAHPADGGWMPAPYDNTLTISIRLGSVPGAGWLGTLPHFWNSGAFDEQFLLEMVESTRQQLNFESEHLPRAANWRINAAQCLLYSSIRLACLPEAKRWQKTAVRTLNDAFRRQILPDGAHVERTPSYHVGMTRVIAMLWQLAGKMPEIGLTITSEQVARMWDYAAATVRPNTQQNALHDTCGKRKTDATSADEPGILQERAEFRRKAGLPDKQPPTHGFFPDAGQAMLRTDWSPEATYIVFDATPWSGGHSHRSCNSIQLHAHRRTLIADPGYFNYEMSDPFAAYGKSTRAHSTCSLNGWTQHAADPEHTTYRRGNGYDVVTSEWNAGYCSGTLLWQFSHHGTTLWASHKRTMIWLHHLGLVILDSMTRQHNLPQNEETPDDCPFFECNWQLSEESRVGISSAERAVAKWQDAGLLMLFPLIPTGAQIKVHEGETQPLRGWMPYGVGKYTPAPQVSLTLDPMLPDTVHLCSVLVPFAVREPYVNAACEADHRFASLQLQHSAGSEILAWSWDRRSMLGIRDEFETDASLVHLRRNQSGEIISYSGIDGTFVEIRHSEQ